MERNLKVRNRIAEWLVSLTVEQQVEVWNAVMQASDHDDEVFYENSSYELEVMYGDTLPLDLACKCAGQRINVCDDYFREDVHNIYTIDSEAAERYIHEHCYNIFDAVDSLEDFCEKVCNANSTYKEMVDELLKEIAQ